jgi:hypothetical protein
MLPFRAHKENIGTKLFSQATPEERLYLDAFFKSSAFTDLSYVLFGHKPFSFITYCNPNARAIPFDSISIKDLKVRKGLEIFEKYQLSSLSNDFFFRIYKESEDAMVILLNKNRFLKVIDKNKKDFESILGNHITSKELLTKIIETDNLEECINNHVALFGILLGYGRNNAWLFHQKIALKPKLNEFNLSLKKQNSLENELEEINKKMGPFSDRFESQQPFATKLFLPGFMADANDWETKKLKKKYTKDRKKIAELQTRSDFSKIVLERLCS